jgi:hypothetical protein
MKINRIVCTVALAGLAWALTGCVVTSVYPFHFEKDLVFEPALLGDWVKDAAATDHWKFEREGPDAYRLTYTDSQKSSVAQARLFKLRDQTFLDLYASEPKDEGLFPTIPSHLLLRVVQTGPTLAMAALNDKWLRQLVEKNPKALRHLFVQEGIDKRLVLTADTAELQRFVVKHLKTEAAWETSEELQRATAMPPSR